MAFPRAMHTLTALGDGRVLAAGGFFSFSGVGMETKIEIYSPTEDRFSQIQIGGAAVELSEPRALHAATMLDDGTVLIAGGVVLAGNPSSTAEIFNPSPTKLWIL